MSHRFTAIFFLLIPLILLSQENTRQLTTAKRQLQQIRAEISQLQNELNQAKEKLESELLDKVVEVPFDA